MKRMITSPKERAEKFLMRVDPDAIDYVREFKEEVDDLTVLDSDGVDFVEVDPSDEINAILHQYVMFGIDEDIIDDLAEFEAIYEALCIVDGTN